MSLVTLCDILPDAQEKRYAVGAFNVTNFEMAISIVQAAEEKRSPVIIQYTEADGARISFEEIGCYVRHLAERSCAPVCVHFDHGTTFDGCIRAIHSGFSSVMFDGSELPFEENVAMTQEIVRIAHAVGVSVEAEIGRMIRSGGEPLKNPDLSELMTDPAVAKEFAERTGADAIAVSFGTVHGVYKTEPHLDFDLLGTLAANIVQPLVVHGGSGLKPSDYREMAARGICKINYYSDMANRIAKNIVSDLHDMGENIYIHDWTDRQLSMVKQEIEERMDVFGSVARA